MSLFTLFLVLLFAIVQVKTQFFEFLPITDNNINNVVIITNANYNDTCLGALIHPLWVVTSAVCALKTIYHDKRVFFSNTPADFDYATFIANIYIHPNFNKEPLNDDIALINLATPADKFIRTLKIPKSIDDLTAKKALSFGQYNTGFNNPSISKVSRVVLMNQELCAKYPVSISETRFCAYPAIGCEGDEGGPLILDNLLIGVTSITPIQAALCEYSGLTGKCNSLFPVTTFTNLVSYKKWIITVTGLAIF